MGRRLIYLFFVIISAFILSSCADAGSDKEAFSKHKVILDGSNSTPSRGWKIIAYNWTQIKGTNVKLNDNNKAKAWFIAPDVDNKQELTFLLTITEKEAF